MATTEQGPPVGGEIRETEEGVRTVTIDADTIDKLRARGGLFDPEAYEDPRLNLENGDGRRIDDIAIGFTGTIVLNRRDPDDVAFYRDLQLGKTVEFNFAGSVSGDAETIKPATDKSPELLLGKRTIRIHSLDHEEL